MALVIADRVRDTTTTTGAGDLTLSGTAPSGYRTFASVCATGDNVYYCVTAGSEWEIGYGTLTAATTLARSRIISSSNSNSVVTLSAGTKDVFITIPATIVQSRGTVWATANGYALN